MLGKLRRLFWRVYGMAKRGELPKIGHCPDCKQYGILRYVYPMTMYVLDSESSSNDPNYVGHLCKPCGLCYYDYWSERWSDYYSGLL